MKTISVIVPVYNSEKYLCRCVESAVMQTLRPTEILLIDDGSNDACRALCDALEKEHDGLVRAIHKANGGAASARNVGIRLARGELLAFVDSDDYIDPIMLEHLSSLIEKYHADVAACEMVVEKDGRGYCRAARTAGELEKCWGTKEALIQLCSCRYLYESVCTAVFSRRLFDGLWFAEGRTCEDHAILHRLFARSRAVVYSSRPLYHYEQHSGSVSKTKRLHMDTVTAAKERLAFFERNCPELLFAARTNYALACMSVYTDSLRDGVPCPRETVSELRGEAWRALPDTLRNQYLPRIKKLQLACFCMCLPLYRAIITRTEHR